MSFHLFIIVQYPNFRDLPFTLYVTWNIFLSFPFCHFSLPIPFFPISPSCLSIFCKLAALVRQRVYLFGKESAWWHYGLSPSLSLCHFFSSNHFPPNHLHINQCCITAILTLLLPFLVLPLVLIVLSLQLSFCLALMFSVIGCLKVAWC